MFFMSIRNVKGVPFFNKTYMKEGGGLFCQTGIQRGKGLDFTVEFPRVLPSQVRYEAYISFLHFRVLKNFFGIILGDIKVNPDFPNVPNTMWVFPPPASM